MNTKSWSYIEDVQVPTTTLVKVSRVARGSFNAPYEQNMTISEAVKFGAWDSVDGTMYANVTIAEGDHAGCVVVRGQRTRKNGFPVDGKRSGNGWYAQVEVTP